MGHDGVHYPEPMRQALGLPPEPPSLIDKAVSVTTAVVRFVGDGCRVSMPEVIARREAICRACPHLDQRADSCGICGCTVMSAKRAMPLETCPDKPPRWLAEAT